MQGLEREDWRSYDSKKTMPQSYYHKELDFSNNLNDLGRRLFPEFMMRGLPAQSLTWAAKILAQNLAKSFQP